jgi:hypothetical protein
MFHISQQNNQEKEIGGKMKKLLLISIFALFIMSYVSTAQPERNRRIALTKQKIH